MRAVWITLVSLLAFAGIGFWVARIVVAYSAGRGTPVAEVHLTAAMAGLFAGGAAAVLVLIVLLVVTKRRS